ncbi:Sas10 carboxy-terminal domain protein [Gregarina niphandrodes]|uniref:Sas10 carboxy-terminal domain protein n=1 Tax=Gregarina niphandrodes TaxID=110365 RepID=A0A023B2I9_GRENI|nr:Sas10 carboxy-terminal domain protein [Gregarina niphandrodes]EZG55043.1 Sas10 carboxy-terminal domain protein [Gregarina niphandrodes]|eukprot:XP_011131810.1 Sas10 carboxy-terminal domain protein [Gregarina niphandrodes]
MARPRKQTQGVRKPQHIHAPKKSKTRKERVPESDGFVAIGNTGHKTGQVARRPTKNYQSYESEDEEDQWAEQLDKSEDEDLEEIGSYDAGLAAGEEKSRKPREERLDAGDPFLGRDSWGRSIRNFYDEEGSEGSSSEAEDDMARALQEALAIRQSHMGTVAAEDMGFNDYLALGAQSVTEGETKSVNDEKVALDLLLTGLSGSAREPDSARDAERNPAALELLQHLSEEYKELKERVKKESMPALQLAAFTDKGPRPTEACMDLLAFQLQICLWMASFFNGCAAVGLTPEFLLHSSVLTKALKKYAKVRKEMGSPGEWEVLRDELRVALRNRGDSAITVSTTSLKDKVYDRHGDRRDDHADMPGKMSVLERRAMKKAARLEMQRKKALDSLPKLPAEIQDPTSARELSRNIKSNRGLMRIRKKYSGHARVANKLKYAKKVKKLSGRLRKADEQTASGDYAGESHGITSHVNRSRKLQ